MAQGVGMVLGPGVNIKRSPLCGRNFEYFSEDPLLSGKLAAAMIRGIQSTGVSACVKHFAANSQELRRMATNSVMDERTLREIYLPAFETAVKEGGVRSLMTAYNRLNGTYCNENEHLLRDILRGEWGFDGLVVSDWGGNNDRVAAVRAGSSLEMPASNGETDRTSSRPYRTGRSTRPFWTSRWITCWTLFLPRRKRSRAAAFSTARRTMRSPRKPRRSLPCC